MQTHKTFDKWLDQNQITLSMTRVMCNPNLMGKALPEPLEHFRCRLFKRDRHVDVYLSLHPEHDNVSPNDALFMLAMDAASCRLLEDYEQYKDDWLADIGECNKMHAMVAGAFWEEYATRCTQLRKLRSFLGESAFEEMLEGSMLPTELEEAS